jgi:transposase
MSGLQSTQHGTAWGHQELLSKEISNHERCLGHRAQASFFIARKIFCSIFECYAKTGQGWDKNLDSLCSILESELKTLDATFRFHTGGSLMKYTKKERMNIGRQIYEDQINKYEAAGKYGISAQTAREYMRMYRNTNHLPPKTSKPRDYGLAKAKVIPEAAKLDEYQKMSKEDLISALIDARIREERLKLGYEVVEEDDSKKKLITYVKKTAK